MLRKMRRATAEEAPLPLLEVLYEEAAALGPGSAGGESAELLRQVELARERYATSGAADAGECETDFRDKLLRLLHAHQRAALCFSGGGIRSATFGLGVLEGLAKRSVDTPMAQPTLLGEFDYLSTVSGGGYLGGWFSAWSKRQQFVSADGTRELKGAAGVIAELASVPEPALDPEPKPLRYLRNYTSYLTPQVGALSADTWTLAATVVRNLLLNWMLLLPLLAAVLLVPVLSLGVVSAPYTTVPGGPTFWFLLVTGALLIGISTAYIALDLPSLGNQQRSQKSYLGWALLPMVLAAVQLTTYWAWLPAAQQQQFHWWAFAAFGGGVHAAGMLAGLVLSRLLRRPLIPLACVKAVLSALLTGAIGGALMFGIVHLLPDTVGGLRFDNRLYTALAFTSLLSVVLAVSVLLVGLASNFTQDDDREWWARSSGWLLLTALAWPIISFPVLYAPTVLALIKMPTLATITAVLGSLVSRIGYTAKTPPVANAAASTGPPPLWQRLGVALILPVFLIALIILISDANYYLLRRLTAGVQDLSTVAPWTVPTVPLSMATDWTANPVAEMIRPLIEASGYSLILLALLLLFGWVVSLFINVNRFSLHAMYRARLIRAYLGASRKDRKPSPFTGFDAQDNLKMDELDTGKPMHVVNMALNLVKGSNLAWQQRKAEPFTSTRLHSGSCRVGYRPSKEYGDGISLGTAITISGAAASPNMGYHSSPLLTLVLTLFNARLGWWLGNPRAPRKVWTKSGPTLAIRPFLDEAFGRTNDTNDWIYLSDGGHFENLGLYEMVLRRCHTIVVSDAGQDDRFKYEDLGNAVRKVRIDLGIQIDFLEGLPVSGEIDRRHCAVGVIRYSCVDGVGAPDGVLVYCKPAISGDEPADVAHYASANPEFPHEPTSDQFFNEAQFESYRRLGSHTVEAVCGGDTGKALTLKQFVELARKYGQRTKVTEPARAAGV